MVRGHLRKRLELRKRRRSRRRWNLYVPTPQTKHALYTVLRRKYSSNLRSVMHRRFFRLSRFNALHHYALIYRYYMHLIWPIINFKLIFELSQYFLFKRLKTLHNSVTKLRFRAKRGRKLKIIGLASIYTTKISGYMGSLRYFLVRNEKRQQHYHYVYFKYFSYFKHVYGMYINKYHNHKYTHLEYENKYQVRVYSIFDRILKRNKLITYDYQNDRYVLRYMKTYTIIKSEIFKLNCIGKNLKIRHYFISLNAWRFSFLKTDRLQRYLRIFYNYFMLLGYFTGNVFVKRNTKLGRGYRRRQQRKYRHYTERYIKYRLNNLFLWLKRWASHIKYCSAYKLHFKLHLISEEFYFGFDANLTKTLFSYLQKSIYDSNYWDYMRHITIPRNPLYTEYINMFPNMLNNIIFYDFTQIKAVNTFYSDIIDKIKSDPKPNPLWKMYRNKEQFHLYKFLNLKYFNKQCYISTENVEEIFPKFEFTSIIQTMVKNNDLICIDLYKVLVLLFYYKIQDNCISIGK